MTDIYGIDTQPCPNCGSPLEACTPVSGLWNGRPPAEDDFSVCGRCYTALRFGPGLVRRIATPEDLKELHPRQRAFFERMARRRGQS